MLEEAGAVQPEQTREETGEREDPRAEEGEVVGERKEQGQLWQVAEGRPVEFIYSHTRKSLYVSETNIPKIKLVSSSRCA